MLKHIFIHELSGHSVYISGIIFLHVRSEFFSDWFTLLLLYIVICSIYNSAFKSLMPQHKCSCLHNQRSVLKCQCINIGSVSSYHYCYVTLCRPTERGGGLAGASAPGSGISRQPIRLIFVLYWTMIPV